MSAQTLLSSHIVPLKDLRSNPRDYFRDYPLAVMSRNRSIGYTLSESLLIDMLTKAGAALGIEKESDQPPSPEYLKRVLQTIQSGLDKGSDL